MCPFVHVCFLDDISKKRKYLVQKLLNDGGRIIQQVIYSLFKKTRAEGKMCHQSSLTPHSRGILPWRFIHQLLLLPTGSAGLLGAFQSGSCIFSSRHAHMAAWTYRLALTSQRSVGVCDKIGWERTYSPVPWLIFTVKDIRQCPTAHNANFWHISVNYMPDLWWHASDRCDCIIVHIRWMPYRRW